MVFVLAEIKMCLRKELLMSSLTLIDTVLNLNCINYQGRRSFSTERFFPQWNFGNASDMIKETYLLPSLLEQVSSIPVEGVTGVE